MTSRTVYPITSIGAPLAERIPRTGRWGTVFTVFRRSCYLESVDGQGIWLSDVQLGEGPLTLGVEFPETTTLSSLGISEGCHLEKDGVDLRLGRATVLRTTEASVWEPETLGESAPPEEILRRLDALTHLLRPLMPSDGIGPIVPHIGALANGESHSNDSANPAVSLAVPCVSRLCDGLIRLDQESVDQSVTGLVGLGPGLTPSGDDLLGGMLVALRTILVAASQPTSVDPFARCVAKHAAVKTTRISAAMLEQSAKGNGSAAQHRLLRCLLGVDTQQDTTAAALDLIRIGHTSGWDALAGILLGIRLGLRMNQTIKVIGSAIQETAVVPA